jgi:L-lactate dehydrogenase
MLPVSSLQTGTYGLSDVCLSVPTIVGHKGIVKHLEIELWSKEEQELKNSANLLKKTLSQLQL